MRALRRHYEKREKARHRRIVYQHWRRPRNIWRHLDRLAMTTPNWWTHEFMVVPARREASGYLRLVEKGFPPDLFQWPDGKKPHIYYW